MKIFTCKCMRKGESWPRENAIPEEYDFWDGVDEATLRIEELLMEQKFVVVGIQGTAMNVGKTLLGKEIVENLRKKGIKAFKTSNISDLNRSVEKTLIKELDHRVIIFDNYLLHMLLRSEDLALLRGSYDKSLAEISQQEGLELTKIDLWIGIYKPRGSGDDAATTNTINWSKTFVDMAIKNPQAVAK